MFEATEAAEIRTGPDSPVGASLNQKGMRSGRSSVRYPRRVFLRTSPAGAPAGPLRGVAQGGVAQGGPAFGGAPFAGTRSGGSQVSRPAGGGVGAGDLAAGSL